MSKFVVITTCRAYPELPADLQPLAAELRRTGVCVRSIPWQECMPSSAELILPLCAWDYATRPEFFAEWLLQAVEFGAEFANSPALMRWNMRKSYLLDLQNKGVDVIPTKVLPADVVQIEQALAEQNWLQAVIKPLIGQSGRLVAKIERGEPLPDLSSYAHGVVLQPYIAEVAESGETSLIFFHGEFSHAVRRQPADNEWRANSAYGVQIHSVKPSTAVIRQAVQVLAKLPETPLYARVDGTVIGERFLLNELELIEPALYLRQAVDFPENITHKLARLICLRLGNHV